MIAMRMGNEGKVLRIPRIKPEILLRQKNAAVVCDVDHS